MFSKEADYALNIQKIEGVIRGGNIERRAYEPRCSMAFRRLSLPGGIKGFLLIARSG